MLTIYIILWLICGFISVGFVIGYFENECSLGLDFTSLMFYFVVFLVGPTGLIPTLASTRCKHDWQLRLGPSDKKRIEQVEQKLDRV